VQGAKKSAQAMETLKAEERDKISDQVVFVDIKWGKPLLTPRDELAKIVAITYKKGAKIVVLDILFEDKDCCNPENDDKLRRVFQDMITGKVATKSTFSSEDQP
jgi:CHASE2 domain-containing sensor protein